MIARRFLLLFAGVALVGCVTKTTRNGVPVDNGPVSAENAVMSDPCASRLHDICGAILLYYAINKQMPARIDELKAMTDIDQPLEFVCPTTQEPYVYVPGGLETLGKDKRIILHDASPAHHGKRWCILMAPLVPGQAPVMEVLLVPEPIFRTYLPVVVN